MYSDTCQGQKRIKSFPFRHLKYVSNLYNIDMDHFHMYIVGFSCIISSMYSIHTSSTELKKTDMTPNQITSLRSIESKNYGE